MPMYFNPKLLEGIPDRMQQVAKLWLFCIQEGISLERHVDDQMGRAVWTQDIMEDILQLSSILFAREHIETTFYINDTLTREHLASMPSTARLKRPLYVSELPRDFSIHEYRLYFSANYLGIPGKMGNKQACIERMERFLMEHPYSFTKVCDATKIVVDFYVQSGRARFLPNAADFIYNREDHSHLLDAIEGMDEQDIV